jgi:superoxide dismutase, Fe-Mn family
MRMLQQLYLDSLGGNGRLPPPMVLALAASFGSAQRWRDEFVAIGKVHAGQPGWVVLTYLPGDGTLLNAWIAGREDQARGGVVVLALEVQATSCVDSFLDSVNWDAVATRYSEAVHVASEGLGAPFDAASQAMVVDVRRAGVFELANTMLPGAQWRDPASIAQWMGRLPVGRDILVYCVHGHEVSRNSAVRLRAHGCNARFLEGGIDAWQTTGRPVMSKTELP